MSCETLSELAALAGIEMQWTDYRGQAHRCDEQTVLRILSALEIACTTPAQRRASLQRLREEAMATPALLTAVVGESLSMPICARQRYRIDTEAGERFEGLCGPDEPLPAVTVPGYHQLLLGDREPLALAVAPPRCFGLRDIDCGRRFWGLTAQIQSLRRAGDGGIGDFGGVSALARQIAPQGADALAISPVHALFAAWPDQFSPYAPSSRLLRNPLLACAEAVFGAQAVRDAIAQRGLDSEFAALEQLPLIDAKRAAAAKRALYRELHARLDASGQRVAFDTWCARAGPALYEHACFELLHGDLLGEDAACAHWRAWPDRYRDPRSAAVAAYAQAHAAELDYRMFEQWLVERSQAAAQRAAREAGMAIGLIGDLAVGTVGSGSHAWSRQRDMLVGLSVGAPPDELNVKGQNWGLTAFSPRALRRDGFAAFIELLRASMQHVGGVRIDHAFGLQRLWLVPEDGPVNGGAYLRYPATELLRLIALESWRHRSVVIGEDLGTMPAGFHERIDACGLYGMRVLWFQREHGLFVDPARWPRGTVAMTTTHDLPTVAGWWRGRDLQWRAQLDLLEPGIDAQSAHAAREGERKALWSAMQHAGLAGPLQPPADDPDPAVDAAVAFVGATPCELVLLPVEDALALSEQPNIPGTIDEHPNWRRRLPDDVDSAFDARPLRSRLAVLERARKSAAGSGPATQ